MTPTVSDFAVTGAVRRGAEDWLSLGGRILLASIFVVAGLRKLGDFATVTAYMASYGVPAPSLLLPLATALELVGGVLLALGVRARWAALALAGYTAVLTLIFHAFWTFDAKQLQAQLNLFLFHLETIGGLIYVLAYGAGAWSIDRLVERRRSL
jgi:putative oxidoreductase